MGLLRTVVGVSLLVAACGDSAATTTTTTPPPTLPATTAPPTTSAAPQPVVAATPPPGSFTEVAEDHATAAEAILGPGRLAARQFLSGDYEAIAARFDETVAAMVSIDQLAAARDEVESQAPLGERGRERAIQLSPAMRVYAVEVAWGEEALTLSVSFNEADQIAGLGLVPLLPLPPDPAAGFESAATFRLPFEGLWFTFWGGDTQVENYHVEAAVQRHAFDFLIWKDGGTHSGDGTAVTDYWAYGQQVLAPAPGTVVTVVDGLADQTPQSGSDLANPAGNHVIIEVAPGEYLLIAHLQAASITVAEGDVVESGQPIALVGNSGITAEPHIHIHLQGEPVFSAGGSGLPLVFTDYLADGEPVAQDQPIGDQFVANR